MACVKVVKRQVISMNNERAKAGVKTGLVGILVNLLLFVMKMAIGLMSKSASIIGDAINSLSDFLSSLITVFGFKFSQLPADHEHPYGHARFELISGFVISIIMLYLGIDLLRESFVQIMNPKTLSVSPFMFAVLILSVLIKVGLLIFYKRMYKVSESEVILANVKDSRNDIIITLSIIFGMWFQLTFGYRVDAYLAILISLLIIYSSYQMLRDFIRDLLGSRPDDALIQGVQSVLDQDDEIIGYHDLIIHSYGFSRHYATVHVEVDDKTSLVHAHSVIDVLEEKVLQKYHVDLVIHLDPLDLDSPLLKELNDKVEEILLTIHEDLSYHDLRLIHNNLIFDVVVTSNVSFSDEELLEMISKALADEPYRLKLTFDRNYLLA